MNKTLLSLLLICTTLLSACASKPVVTKFDTVQGALANVKTIQLRAQPDPAITDVRFNTTGYTIIGVAFVAAAVAKMDAQSKEFEQLVADYSRQHPEVPTLQAAFNDAFIEALQAKGVSHSAVEVNRITTKEGASRYQVADAGTPGAPIVVIDGLKAQFLATSSTDPYGPASTALVTVLDGDSTRQSVVFASAVGSKDASLSFAGFDDIKKDVPASYAVLLQAVRDAARRAADALLAKG